MKTNPLKEGTLTENSAGAPMHTMMNAEIRERQAHQ